jgi:metal-sulfur cluster biosynthetic enzyme
MVTKEDVYKAISTVIDPEVGFNLVAMGLIYDAIIEDNGKKVKVVMTLSTRACPLHQMIVQWVEEAVLREIPEVDFVDVELVWEPAWNISMASDEVKRQLSGI